MGSPCESFTPNRRSDWSNRTFAHLSEEELRAHVTREAFRPFDLQRGPLFRGTVYHRGDDDHVLLFVTHHIVCDFWSLVIMLEHLDKIYRGQTSNVRQVTYDEYVEWERDYLDGVDGGRLWEFWKQELAGPLPLLNLPTDRPYPARLSEAGSIVNFQVDSAIHEGLRQLAHDHDTTLFTVLLAAYQLLLYRYSGQHDLLIGTPAACRERWEFEHLVGYVANMVVLRGDLAGNPTFNQLLRRTRAKVLRCLDHREYPFHCSSNASAPNAQPPERRCSKLPC